ncbi:hypothetical protein X975_12717, partial [Stegodyphus mimosarum]
MRLLLIALLFIGILLVLPVTESQSVGNQIRCWTCPGNDADHKDCCEKTKMCCEGRVKFIGNFPRPS